MSIDYGVYYITDVRRFPVPEILAEHAATAIRAGAGIVQLRDKTGTDEAFLARARRLREVCTYYDVPLIINDRIDIAMAVDADGVHLGPSDESGEAARRQIGPDKLLGLSANNPARIDEAVAVNADYIGVGALFETDTKVDARPLSPEVLRTMRQRTDLPLIGIGGITPENVGALANSGLDGIAVISALSKQSDPTMTVRRLKAATCSFHQPRAAVLDLDGVLLDTHDVWAAVFTDFCRAYEIRAEGLFREIWQMSWSDAARCVIQRGTLYRTPEDVLTEWFDMAAEYYQNVSLFPGVRSNLKRFTARVPRVVVATALPAALTKRAMTVTRIADYFEEIHSLYGVQPDKRNEQFYRRLAAKWAIPPRALLLMEDDGAAIRAAKRAGWRTIYVTKAVTDSFYRFADAVVPSFTEAVGIYG